VQENHHVAAAFRLMREEEFNWAAKAKAEVGCHGGGSRGMQFAAHAHLSLLDIQGFHNL
jgi:hypothetical protein